MIEEQKPKEKAKISPKFNKLSFKVQDYYAIQDIRIRAENRLRLIEYAIGTDEKKKPDNWEKVVDMKIDQGYLDSYNEKTFKRVRDTEKEISKMIAEDLLEYNIFNKWLSKVKGIGPVLAGGLISIIHDITLFSTVSKLTKYAGLHTDEEGKAVRRKKGVQVCWNPRFKVLLWKCGESFVKSKGQYQKVYKHFRKFYDAKYPNESKAHRYSMAKRKTVTIFLSNLFEAWYKVENKMPDGCTTTKPWIIAKGGHKDYIDPWDMITEKELYFENE
jgi:hypothetical protein